MPITAGCKQTHFALWADGNRLRGSTEDPEGSIDLICRQDEQARR